MSNEFNPSKSLFGRHNYAFEQAILRQFQHETDKALFLIDPEIVRMPPTLIRLLPIHKRRDMVLKRLESSSKLLDALGV